MVKSMTGFGKANINLGNKKLIIELKSLNSKQFDLIVKIPNIYKEWEMELRNIVKENLVRGKVEFTIYFENSENSKNSIINKDVVAQYYKQICNTTQELGITVNDSDLIRTIMRLPDTITVSNLVAEENDIETLKEGILDAISNLNAFREQEGQALISDIKQRIYNIQTLSKEVEKWEAERIETVKQRISDKLTELQANIDQNRFEQELIFYIEKFDITEEKIRLANHCQYFVETAEKEEHAGRKLGFIAQEIGREINTMGSKANHHDIQKIVVDMKDELEKIKEQVLNLL